MAKMTYVVNAGECIKHDGKKYTEGMDLVIDSDAAEGALKGKLSHKIVVEAQKEAAVKVKESKIKAKEEEEAVKLEIGRVHV